MSKPAAKQDDRILAIDIHTILVPFVGPTPVPHPFTGIIDGKLSPNVEIEKKPAATVGSTATNTPRHIPIGGSFAKEPTNRGEIITGSGTVLVNGKPAARLGDTALTCNDPADLPVGTVVAVSTVLIGD